MLEKHPLNGIREKVNSYFSTGKTSTFYLKTCLHFTIYIEINNPLIKKYILEVCFTISFYYFYIISSIVV